MAVFNWPINPTTSGPVQYLLDGNAQTVLQDTAVPANNKPLPVQLIDSSGVANAVRITDGTDTLSINADGSANAIVTATNLDIRDLSSSSDSVTVVSSALTALAARSAGSLIPVEFDEVVQTYVGATTRLNTVTFRLAAVTVRTLTFSYDGSDRLTGVVAS